MLNLGLSKFSLCLAYAFFLQWQLHKRCLLNTLQITVTEWVSGKGTAGNHLGQPSLQQELFSWSLNISSDGGSTTFLNNLFQCLVTFIANWGFFLGLNSISCGFICFHRLFSCHWALLSYTWLHFLPLLPTTQHIFMKSSKNICQLGQPQISAFLMWRVLQSLSQVCGHSLDSYQLYPCLLYLGARIWTQHSSCVSPALSRGKESPPLTCWWHSSECSQS